MVMALSSQAQALCRLSLQSPRLLLLVITITILIAGDYKNYVLADHPNKTVPQGAPNVPSETSSYVAGIPDRLLDATQNDARIEVLNATHTPRRPMRYVCSITSSYLCSWRNAAFVTQATRNAVENAQNSSYVEVFHEHWHDKDDLDHAQHSKLDELLANAFRLRGGFQSLLCTGSGRRCTAAATAVFPNSSVFTWSEHFQLQREELSRYSSGTIDGALHVFEDSIEEVISEAITSARKTAGPHGAWIIVPFTFCKSATTRTLSSGVISEFSASARLNACLSHESGTSVPYMDGGIMLFAYMHVRIIPPESIPAAFAMPGLRSDDEEVTRDGIVALSYFYQSQDGEILPCSSLESSPCAIHNSHLLASRVKAHLASCSGTEWCVHKILQGVTRSPTYTIAKTYSANYFYAFIVDKSGYFIAHGGNDANVGRNINTDFGEQGSAAYRAIIQAGINEEGYGSQASYMWQSAACQALSIAFGDCEPTYKSSTVFSMDVLGTKLFIGVGLNHARPQFSAYDPGAPEKDRSPCVDSISLPCGDLTAQRLVTYTYSALELFDAKTVFDDINSGSNTYREGNFYVFVLDMNTGIFYAHGNIPRVVEESLSIVSVAKSLGMEPNQLNGEDLLTAMQDMAGSGGGYVYYNWTHAKGIVPKVSYVLGLKTKTQSAGESQSDLIIGSGFSHVVASANELKPGQDKCVLTLNGECSRNLILGKVGYTQASASVALAGAVSGGFDEFKRQMNANSVAFSNRHVNLTSGEWPNSKEWSEIGVSLFHRYGSLIASNEPCLDGNGTWGDRYAGERIGDILSFEIMSVSKTAALGQSIEAPNVESPLANWAELSAAGGGFMNTRTTHWGFVSSLICGVGVMMEGDACAFLVAEQPNTGCGDGLVVQNEVCVPCEAGNYIDVVSQKCLPCSPGSFTARAGQTSCTLCADLPDAHRRYQNASGATSCELCPDNTLRFLTDPATSINECHCADGFYQSDRKPNGAACDRCMEGAVCNGAEDRTNVDPYPEEGYWGQKDYPHEFLECELGVKACLGGKNFSCAPGTFGTMCSECEVGYFSLYDTGLRYKSRRMYMKPPAGERACSKCADGGVQWSYTLLVSLGIFSVWFILNEIPYEVLNVSLEFMQISDIIGKFNLDWPVYMASVWQVISQIVNFDPDIVVMWQCHYPAWRYQAGVLLLMALPFFKTGIFLIYHLMKRFALHLVKNGRISRFPFGLATNQKQVDEAPDALLGEFISFNHILYLALAERAFDVFSTTPRPDGREFVEEAPWITTGTPIYNRVLILCSFMTVIYVVGMPILVAWVIYNGRQKRVFNTRKYLNRYGWLYHRYNATFYYWELVIILRRITLVLTLKFAGDDPMLQAACGLILCGIFSAMQSYARPFRRPFVDQLDFAACVVNMVYIVTGMVETYASNRTVKKAFEVVITVLFVLIISACAVLLTMEHMDNVAHKRSTKAASKRFHKMLTEECIPDENETVEEARKRVMKIMSASRVAFRLLDHQCNGVVDETELEKNFPLLYGPNGRGVKLTAEMARGLSKVIQGISIDDYRKDVHQTADGDIRLYFEEKDFLVHIGRELMSRNVNIIGQGTGVRAELRKHGLDRLGITETFVSDAIYALSDVIENTPNFGVSFANSQQNLEYAQFLDLYNAEENMRLLTEGVLAEMLDTLDSYGVVGLFEDGISKQEAMEIIRLEKQLDNKLRDDAMLSDFSHSSYAATLRTFVKGCPAVLEYISDPTLCPYEELEVIEKMLRYVSKQFDDHGSHSSPFSSMISEMDHAALMDWLFKTEDRNRNSFLVLVYRVYNSRKSSGSRFAMEASDILHGKTDPFKRIVAHRWKKLNLKLKVQSSALSMTKSNTFQRKVLAFGEYQKRKEEAARGASTSGGVQLGESTPITPFGNGNGVDRVEVDDIAVVSDKPVEIV